MKYENTSRGLLKRKLKLGNQPRETNTIFWGTESEGFPLVQVMHI